MNEHSPKTNKKHANKALLWLGPLTLAIIAVCFYAAGERYISTDDAYVESHKVSVAAEVTGRVATVNVTDNSHVKAGDLLLSLDKEPFKIAVQQAEANLAVAKTSTESARAEYLQSKAEFEQSEEALRYQQQLYDRYTKLVKANAASVEQFDAVVHNRDQAAKDHDAKAQAMASKLGDIGGNADLPTEQQPRYLQAKAALDKAILDLSRADLFAPSEGTVAHVTIRPGAYVVAGLPLFSLVEDKHVWIEANFKETDLTHVQSGQLVSVDVDAFPGRKWTGKVSSITPGTGSAFSVLPAENSSGNWVKVVQRVMVRVELDDYNGTPALSSGMSCSVTIDTGRTRLERMLGRE